MNSSSLWAMRQQDGEDTESEGGGGGGVAMSISSGAQEAGGLEEFNKYFLSLSPYLMSGEMKITPFLDLIKKKFREITVESVIDIEGLKIDEEEKSTTESKRGRGRPRSENPTKKAIELREKREATKKAEQQMKAEVGELFQHLRRGMPDPDSPYKDTRRVVLSEEAIAMLFKKFEDLEEETKQKREMLDQLYRSIP